MPIHEVRCSPGLDTKGDDIEFSGERSCADSKLIAFESFNWNPGYVPPNDKLISNLVSASLDFKKAAEQSGSLKDEWQEYDVFAYSDDFQWSELPTEYADRFKGDSCILDTTPGEKNKSIRVGFILRSRQARSSHLLAPDVWRRCNSGKPEQVGRADFPQFRDCKYEHLEFFIPASQPETFCKERTAWDEWFHPGVKKFVLADRYEELKSLARRRWDETTARPVDAGEWDRLSKGLPKVCMRYVNLDGTIFPDKASDWSEFASVAAVWCDH